MTRQDRFTLSLLAEPGDPRMRDLLLAHEPSEIVAAVVGRHRLAGGPVPQSWRERGCEVDRVAQTVAARAAKAGLRWITPGDVQWPSALADLDHVGPFHGSTGAPVGLWLRGTGDLAEVTEQAVAIVGARDCTTYGAECASEIAADCCDAGWSVVSGAAYGVDGCAHRGAFLMNKPTVAVLACGADVDYPRSHGALLNRIAENGVVVSEQAPGGRPMKGRFLSRNRIIAALSGGTVVIEAALRSGSLNTLTWADQLGRTTMGLPGPVTSRQSAGVHAAIRAGKAVLVTGGPDVVAELQGIGAEVEEQTSQPLTEFDQLPPEAQRTLDGLDWRAATTAAVLASTVRLGVGEVSRALDLLESRGLVTNSGSEWTLVRRADVG